MFISPAYAQSGGIGGAGGLEAMLPLVLIFVVFYFLLIRPQQKKMKDHRSMLGDISRGDKIVTGGGIMGTVTKVDDDNQVTVEIAKDIKVKVRRELISAVQNKNAPVAANDAGSKPSGGLLSGLSGLFGGGSKPHTEAEPEKPATKLKPATKAQTASKKKLASKEKPAVEEKSEPAEDDRK